VDDESYVVRSNITRFERMLDAEQDPQRRTMLSALLAEERLKLKLQSAQPKPLRP
jgi:hypothetical protein